MKIPQKIKIGNTEYKVKKKNYYFNKTLGGQINYNLRTMYIRKSGIKVDEEENFFHEIAHGTCKELEFNYPKIVAFRNNESFIQELGIVLRKTFLDLLKKQKNN